MANVLFNNIKPGRKLTCIDNSDERFAYIDHFIKEGENYIVEEIIGENGVKLVGVPGIWRAMRFEWDELENLN